MQRAVVTEVRRTTAFLLTPQDSVFPRFGTDSRTSDNYGNPCVTNTSWAGSTLTWNIARLDDSLREMTYLVDACDCASVGDFVETLASVSYTDDDNSPAIHPTLPTSIAFDVVDPSETCGVPSVTVGEQCFEARVRTCNSHRFSVA